MCYNNDLTMILLLRVLLTLKFIIMAIGAFGGAALGAAFSGIGSLFGSGLSYKRQRKLLGQQYEYDKEAASVAYDRQLDFWNQQNEYNDPSSVRARLEGAGLNPALAYGGTAQVATPAQGLSHVDKASAGGTPQSPQAQFENPIDSLLQLSRVENINADTRKKEEETAFVRVESDYYKAQGQLLGEQTLSEQTRRAILDLDRSFKSDTYQANVASSVANLNKVVQEGLKTKLYNENYSTFLREAESRIALNAVQSVLNKTRVSLTEEQRNKIASEISLLSLQWDIQSYARDNKEEAFWSKISHDVGGVVGKFVGSAGYLRTKRDPINNAFQSFLNKEFRLPASVIKYSAGKIFGR